MELHLVQKGIKCLCTAQHKQVLTVECSMKGGDHEITENNVLPHSASTKGQDYTNP